MSEDDLMKAFTSMGMEDGQEGFMPMMQGMMKSLLSKEILYPSLKELSKKVSILKPTNFHDFCQLKTKTPKKCIKNA